ncbi:MAG: hypothetical protein AB1349_01855 [Elusimicrobiota bacterium]
MKLSSAEKNTKLDAKEEAMKDRFHYIGLTVGVFVVIICFFSCAEQKYSYVTPEGSLERIIEKVAVDVMGKTVNWSGRPRTVIEISKTEQVSGPDNGGYLITIKYRANENLTRGLIKTGIIIDGMNLIKKLYHEPGCSQVKVYVLIPYLTLVDKYGKKSEEQIGGIVLRRAVADRINLENIFQDRFEQILQSDGQLWLHPAITK